MLKLEELPTWVGVVMIATKSRSGDGVRSLRTGVWQSATALSLFVFQLRWCSAHMADCACLFTLGFEGEKCSNASGWDLLAYSCLEGGLVSNTLSASPKIIVCMQ